MLQPSDLIGEFVIEKLLSDAGGMSTVYLAHHARQPNRWVAIKVSSAENINAFQDLLRDEADILSKLHHPSIVHLFSQDINGKTRYALRAIRHEYRPWYYVMEFLPYNSLDGWWETIGRFPLAWKIELFYQVLITIDYMHKVGIAHCDLKPTNLVFRAIPKEQEQPLPVLIDFGSSAPISQIKEKMGTIRYTPPEVLRAMSQKNPQAHFGIRADKVDIWQLGTLLYEIISGKPLFKRNHTRLIKNDILEGKIKRISNKRAGISPSFDRLLREMLRSDPNKRPNTEQIIEALDDRISTVRPPRIALNRGTLTNKASA